MPAAHRASLETHLSAQQPGLRKDLATGPASCKPSGQRGCGAPTPPRPPRGPRVSRACAVGGGRDAAPTAPWHLPAGAPLPTRAHGACVLSGCSPRGPGHSAAGQACTPLPRGSRGGCGPLAFVGCECVCSTPCPCGLGERPPGSAHGRPLPLPTVRSGTNPASSPKKDDAVCRTELSFADDAKATSPRAALSWSEATRPLPPRAGRRTGAAALRGTRPLGAAHRKGSP